MKNETHQIPIEELDQVSGGFMYCPPVKSDKITASTNAPSTGDHGTGGGDGLGWMRNLISGVFRS